MSKKYNQGKPKARVIKASVDEMKKRVTNAQRRGVRRGKQIGEAETISFYNSLPLWKRLYIAVTGGLN